VGKSQQYRGSDRLKLTVKTAMPLYQVTSLSNASLDVYPNNSLTKFVHQLPIPIEFDQTQDHTIELRSISLAFDLKYDLDHVSFVKLHVEELDQRNSSHKGDARCLARIPFSSSHKGEDKTLWHEFRHPIAIPLTHISRLDKLSYLLTDEHNQQLDLKSGVTTVLNILIREMKHQDHFSITLNPTVSEAMFSKNVNNDFRTSFPSDIELGPGWEVALHSVIVPRYIHVEPMYEVRINSEWGQETVQWIIKDISDAEFFQALSDKLLSWGLGFQFDTDQEDNNLVQISTPSDDPEFCSLHLNAAVYEFFGENPKSAASCFNFDTQLSIEHISRNRKRKSIADRRDSRIEHIAVYCDILSDSIIGNSFSPLLDIISCSAVGLTKPEENTLYHMPNLTYRPVAKEIFSTIRLKMCMMDGKPAPISSKDQNISTTLYFRQKHE